MLENTTALVSMLLDIIELVFDLFQFVLYVIDAVGFHRHLALGLVGELLFPLKSRDDDAVPNKE